MTIKTNSKAGEKMLKTIREVIRNGEHLKGSNSDYFTWKDIEVILSDTDITVHNCTKVSGIIDFKWAGMVSFKRGKIYV